MTFNEGNQIRFASDEHRNFFIELVNRLHADIYLKALIYAVGICPDTRYHWACFFDEDGRSIKLDVIYEGWQTGTSLKLTRLAFQLYTDGTPTAFEYDQDGNEIGDITEVGRYSVSDIFCCEHASFFVEAIKIRYPEYFL